MEILLCTAKGKPESGNYLIKDQKCTICLCNLSEEWKEIILWKYNSHVCGNRFHNNSCNLIRVCLKQFFYRFLVVICRNQCMFCIISWHSRTVRNRCCKRCRTCFYKKSIRMSMITSLKLNDFVSFRISSGTADRTHNRFCSRTYQTADLHRRHQFCDQLCNFNFSWCWCTKGKSHIARFFYFLDYTRIGMTKDSRSPGTYIVDHFIAIYIGDSVTFCRYHKSRSTAHCPKCTDRTVHSSWNPEFCSSEIHF